MIKQSSYIILLTLPPPEDNISLPVSLSCLRHTGNSVSFAHLIVTCEEENKHTWVEGVVVEHLEVVDDGKTGKAG